MVSHSSPSREHIGSRDTVEQVLKKRHSEKDAFDDKHPVLLGVHPALDAKALALAGKAVIRLAGFSEEGKPLGRSKLREDLQLVSNIESGLVVDPADIEAQLRRLKELTSNTSTVPDSLVKFERLGGHAFLNDPKTLIDVMRIGYVIILEYVLGNKRVPGGTIYGFDKSFTDNPTYPTLGLNSIGAPDDVLKRLADDRYSIVTNWRTSVPENFASLEKFGINIPSELKKSNISPRRLGAGTRLKFAITDPAKKILLLNIGVIQPIGGLLGTDVRIENRASDKCNGEFLKRSRYCRNHYDKLNIGDSPIAEIHWQVYWNWIENALWALQRDGGVLQGKGIGISRDARFKKTIWRILSFERSKILEMVERL